ncbi:MAG: hypothetical protein U9N85_01225 [Bacteroidota bacterium]|nr:hypothetical protein [Bacteroidota bacterium]
MLRTNGQNKRLHQLFSKLGIDAELKSELVHQFTGGRSYKSSEMLYNECTSLIKTLEMRHQKKERKHNDFSQKLRRNVLKLCYDVGFIYPTMNTTEKITIINAFIRQKTKYKKEFNQLSIKELQQLINQLRAVRRNYEDSITRQARLN